jgi:hypothetical protein
MYRLFVALDFPEQVRLELGRLCFGLKGAKWMTEDQLHLTVRFIGEVDGAVFRDIKEALQTVTAEPFDLELRGIGFFPPKRNPEILWVGTEKNPSLDHLKQNRIDHCESRCPPGGPQVYPTRHAGATQGNAGTPCSALHRTVRALSRGPVSGQRILSLLEFSWF